VSGDVAFPQIAANWINRGHAHQRACYPRIRKTEQQGGFRYIAILTSAELCLLQALFVQTSVFLAYGIMAIPSALLMRRFAYKAGLLAGLIVFGKGTLLFWPAAVVGLYKPFLCALFVLNSGSSILAPRSI
jgi:MFS family permease